jgi:hypothetical protein
MKYGALLVAVGTNTTDVLAVVGFVNDIHSRNSNYCEGLEVPGIIRVKSMLNVNDKCLSLTFSIESALRF